MKNLFLGLVATVGLSCYAFASNTVVKKNVEQKTNNSSVGICSKSVILDCWYGTKTEYYDTDGNLTASVSVGVAAACRPGDSDGSIVITYKRVVEEAAPPFAAP